MTPRSGRQTRGAAIAVLVVVALSGLVAAACGSGSDLPVNAGATQSAGGSAPGVVVLLQYQAFEPSHIRIHVGQTVQWKFEQPGVPGNVAFDGFAISRARFTTREIQPLTDDIGNRAAPARPVK